MTILGWKPLEFIGLSNKQKAVFMAYQDKMSNDPNWKTIMDLKIGIRL